MKFVIGVLFPLFFLTSAFASEQSGQCMTLNGGVLEIRNSPQCVSSMRNRAANDSSLADQIEEGVASLQPSRASRGRALPGQSSAAQALNRLAAMQRMQLGGPPRHLYYGQFPVQ